jgi:hypothetical protein
MYKKLIAYTALSVISLALVNYAAMRFGWYYIFPWFDVLTHFWGGVAVGFGILALLERCGVTFDTFSHALIFLAIFFLVAFGWEFYEIAVNTIFPRYTFDSIDTLWDIVNDSLGALLAFWWVKKVVV